MSRSRTLLNIRQMSTLPEDSVWMKALEATRRNLNTQLNRAIRQVLQRRDGRRNVFHTMAA